MRGLVIGGAACLHDDLKVIGNVDVTVGVNDAGYSYRDLNAAVTLHPEHVCGGGVSKEWLRKRRERGWPDIPWYSFYRPECGIEIWRPETREETTAWTRGSSSLYAVGVLKYVYGVDEVFLAGCPLDDSPNVYTEQRWKQFERYRIGWTKLLPELRGWVFSPSGWTRELLGSVLQEA